MNEYWSGKLCGRRGGQIHRNEQVPAHSAFGTGLGLLIFCLAVVP